MKKNIFLIAFTSLLFVACEPTAIAPTTLYINEGEVEKIVAEDGGTLLTLNEFVDTYMTEEGNFQNWAQKPGVNKKTGHPYRTRATNDGKIFVFSIDTLPIAGPGIYIRGRVITEDIAGNFYKSMVIQQVVDGKQQALRLSVDASSISGQYAIGQELLIRVNGFSIGRYANQPQLCVPSYNNNTYANNATEKVGWAPGRIPAARFHKATKLIGIPDRNKIKVDTLSIQDFVSLDLSGLDDQKAIREMDGKLICLKNIQFTGKYSDTQGNLIDCTTGDPETDQNANVFAPTTNNIGFPQSRVITDGKAFTSVSTSEYAKFARFYLPGCDANGVSGASDYTGSVTGILGYYRDNPKYAADSWDWSVTLRSLIFKTRGAEESIIRWGTENDLKLFNQEGEAWVPQEYKGK